MSNEIESKWREAYELWKAHNLSETQSILIHDLTERAFLAARNHSEADLIILEKELSLYDSDCRDFNEMISRLHLQIQDRDQRIAELSELARESNKHLIKAYGWGIWLYESEEYQEMEDEDEKENMKDDLDIVCDFLNSEKATAMLGDR